MFTPLLALTVMVPFDQPSGHLAIANQGNHSLLYVDLTSRTLVGTADVGVNGHECAFSGDGKFAYVPIYSNVAVGQTGSDGDHIDVVDLSSMKVDHRIELGKAVRPHCARLFKNTLYVSAELDHAIYSIDLKTNHVRDKIPTGQEQSHMFVVSRDGKKGFVCNIVSGSLSVLNLQTKKLEKIIPISKSTQRISISPDSRWVFTQDQTKPQIAVIDAEKGEVVRRIDMPAIAFATGVTPDDKLVATCPSIKKLVVVNLKTDQVMGQFDLPGSPQALQLDAKGKFAYVTCISTGKLAIFDIFKMTMLEPMELMPGIDGMDWFGK